MGTEKNERTFVNKKEFLEIASSCMKYRICPIRESFILWLFFFTAFPLAAQTLPTSTDAETVHRDNLWNSYRIEQEIRQFRNQPAGVAISTPQLPPQLLDEKSDQKILKLNDIIFFPPPQSLTLGELQTIAQKYIRQEKVSIRDLYQMLTEIDALFDTRHIVGRAVLPVQDIENGVVRVQIIEGTIEKTIIAEKRQAIPLIDRYRNKDGFVEEKTPFGQHFIKKHFPIPQGKTLNLKELENEILKFNRKYRTQLIAELEPGDELGGSNLKLTAVVPQMLSGGYFLDNSGRDTSGKIRNGAFILTQSVLGLDEMVYCSFDKTEGTEYISLFSEVPITKFGTYAEFSTSYGTPETLYGDFAVLNINGMSRRYRPGVRQTLLNSKNHKTDLSFAVESYVSETRFDTQINYAEKLTAYTFGISDIRRTKKSVFAGSLSMQLGNTGIKSFDGNVLQPYYYRHYYLLNASLTSVLYPNKKWTLIGKLNGQWALSDLAQSRIYQIGGMATVRGVREGLMSAESGYLLNLEARRMLYQCRQNRLEAFGFFDHGGVFNRIRPANVESADYLSSLGLGIIFSWNKYFSFIAGYGKPQWTKASHKEEYRKALKNGNGYFTLQATF
jgi:hemolysin activation/secretion protein